MTKATSVATTNIAFAKYWGKASQTEKRPVNGSVSMTLGGYDGRNGLQTTTTVEFGDQYNEDEFWLDGEKVEDKKADKVFEHLDRVRAERCAKMNDSFDMKAKVMSENNFPTGTGLSSSASGFAALTVASAAAAGLDLSERELSILSRRGSGSSCRSIPGGFVEWKVGETSEDSYAYQLYPPSHWDLVDVVAVVSESPKKIGSTEGQKLAETSPLFSHRKATMPTKIEEMKKLIETKDFVPFGELLEREALELHAQFITQNPPLLYMSSESLHLMHLVHTWREELDLSVYFTLNTGQDIHLICESETVEALVAQLKNHSDFIKDIIPNSAGEGARLIDQHLF